MKAGISKLSDLVDGAAGAAALVAAGGRWYYCDPTNGHGGGYSAEDATPSLQTAFNLCRDNYNDGVFFIGGATAFNPTAAFDWNKSYTHLIGLSADLPGKGQRCRVVALAATDLTNAMTFSGNGNVIANIQFNNAETTGAIGSATITGLRNLFVNCFFMNPTSVTSTAWAAVVSGAESTFVRCTFGQHTNARTTSSYGLWVKTGGNSLKFIGCEFLSWSDQSAHVLVKLDSGITEEAFQIQFEDCLFENLGNALLTAGIVDSSTAPYHQIVFRGRNNAFVKCTAVANPLTYTYAHEPSGNGSGLLYVIVNESS
jgi:hypothetical protein